MAPLQEEGLQRRDSAAGTASAEMQTTTGL